MDPEGTAAELSVSYAPLCQDRQEIKLPPPLSQTAPPSIVNKATRILSGLLWQLVILLLFFAKVILPLSHTHKSSMDALDSASFF